jgi:hypothetical protein
VPTSFLFSVLAVGLAQAPGSPNWLELYDARKHQQAAAVLHALVLEDAPNSAARLPEVEAAEALAASYLHGKGVERDLVIACSLAQLASMAANARYDAGREAALARVGHLMSRACERLSDHDREDAAQMIGCPRHGPQRQVFTLEPDHSVEVSRSGIRIEHLQQQHTFPTPGCLQRWVATRYTRVEAGDARTRPRHLLEFFYWSPARQAAFPQRVLTWQLFEVVGASAELRAMEQFEPEPGSAWLPPDDSAARDMVTFETGDDGQVVWMFSGSGRRGTIPPLAEVPTVPPAPAGPTSGTARVEVTVLDRFGAPLTDASVKIRGVVTRDTLTNGAGAADLDDLPPGRYDVLAAKSGLATTSPVVIDVGEATTTRLELTMKPLGPRASMVLACGGYDPSNLATLARGADMIVLVRILAQRTVDRAEEGATDIRLRTVNRAHVLQSLKGSAVSPRRGATIDVVQGGGRIDRGEYVETQTYNSLPPLNVGDEYVLFLTGVPDGLWIHGSEHGAFRIRNKRVHPLGGGGVADAWKDRPANAFLEALRAAQ